MGAGADARGRVTAPDGLGCPREHARRPRGRHPDRRSRRHSSSWRSSILPFLYARMGRPSSRTGRRRRPGPATPAKSCGSRPTRSWPTSSSARRTSTSRSRAPGPVERERGHMRDVRSVFAAFAVLALIAVSRARRRRLAHDDRARPGARSAGGRSSSRSRSSPLGVVALIAVRHAVLDLPPAPLPAGSYTFDPATDRLVQLFPFQFWQETAMVVGVVIIALWPSWRSWPTAARPGRSRPGHRLRQRRDGGRMSTIRVGRVAGFAIRIHVSWAIIGTLIAVIVVIAGRSDRSDGHALGTLGHRHRRRDRFPAVRGRPRARPCDRRPTARRGGRRRGRPLPRRRGIVRARGHEAA